MKKIATFLILSLVLIACNNNVETFKPSKSTVISIKVSKDESEADYSTVLNGNNQNMATKTIDDNLFPPCENDNIDANAKAFIFGRNIYNNDDFTVFSMISDANTLLASKLKIEVTEKEIQKYNDVFFVAPILAGKNIKQIKEISPEIRSSAISSILIQSLKVIRRIFHIKISPQVKGFAIRATQDWKVRRIIHRIYGGNIGLSIMGIPMPYEAYNSFFQEMELKKCLVFRDDKFKDKFFSYSKKLISKDYDNQEEARKTLDQPINEFMVKYNHFYFE